MTFKNKTIFITGGSRGICKAIALRMAREGANIVIAAKTVEENAKIPGTRPEGIDCYHPFKLFGPTQYT